MNHPSTGVSYTSALLAAVDSAHGHHHHMASILAVGSDAVIKELEMPELAVAKEIETGLQVRTQIAQLDTIHR